MANEEVIKLILDIVGDQGLQKLSAAAREAKTALQDTYEVGQAATATYQLMASAADTAADKMVKEAVEATRSQKLIRQALDDTATSANKAGEAGKASGRSFLELGRVVQDFAQGGIGGILNNIEGLTMALGGTAGLAGILTIVGVAFLTLKPQIQGFLDSIGEAKTKIPETTGTVEALSEAYAKNKKELDELKEKQKLTADELSRFNELTKEQIKLKDQQENARAAASVTADDTDAAKKRGGAFQKAVGQFGGGKALVDALVGMGYEQATAEDIVAGGLKGREGDIGAATLASKKFAGVYDPLSPEAEERKKRAEYNQGISDQFDGARRDRYEKRLAEAKAAQDKERREQEAADRQTERLKEAAMHEQQKKLEGNVKMVGDTTGIDEMATQAMSQMTLEGGRRNQFTGQLIPMNKEQIETYTMKLVERELKRAYPKSSQKGRGEVAEGITNQARDEMLRTQTDAAARAGQQGLNTNQAQREALIALYNNVDAKLQAQEQQFRGLAQQFNNNTDKVRMNRAR